MNDSNTSGKQDKKKKLRQRGWSEENVGFYENAIGFKNEIVCKCCMGVDSDVDSGRDFGGEQQ